jgi:hypothetical protein
VSQAKALRVNFVCVYALHVDPVGCRGGPDVALEHKACKTSL